jgi:hypothetical protein
MVSIRERSGTRLRLTRYLVLFGSRDICLRSTEIGD